MEVYSILLVIIISQISIDSIQTSESSIKRNREHCNSLKSNQYNEGSIGNRSSCFRVAALELDRAWGSNCRYTTELNLKTYDKACEIASQHGAEMVVFPEDGIMLEPREDLVNCVEEIPDPESLNEDDNNPCLKSSLYNQSMPVLTRLSCMARRSKLYVIANYGTKQSCEPGTEVGEEICPNVGFFMLNTNVVFDPTGIFIKRYRKYHPFTETEIFDKAPSLEHSYFDTPHGRFGIFTCFDLIFKHPTIELVEHYKAESIIFPTWWFDELPMLSSVQYQDGWSWTNNVNFISANILRPSFGSSGSAIFSGNNILNTGLSNRTQLLIANIVRPNTNDCGECGFNPKLVEINHHQMPDKYYHKNTQILLNDSVTLITKVNDTQTLCANDVCCTIDYKFERLHSQTNEKLIMIVRDSPRAGFYGWYEQFCVLATIAGELPSESASEGYKYRGLPFQEQPAFKFEKLSVRLDATTKYVYPIGAHDVGHLIDRRKRYFTCSAYDHESCNTNPEPCKTTCEHGIVTDDLHTLDIYSFGMYGRRYESDIKPKDKIKPRPHYVPGNEF